MSFTAHYSIELPASPQSVFEALTDPARITRWWGDDSVYWMTRVEQELRVGGAANYYGSFTTRDPVSGSSAGREFGGVGVVRAVDPPRMLEYTRRYTDGMPCPEETVIRYELEASPGGTRLAVTHTGFESQAMSDQHAQGWERVFAWLARYLAADAAAAR